MLPHFSLEIVGVIADEVAAPLFDPPGQFSDGDDLAWAETHAWTAQFLLNVLIRCSKDMQVSLLLPFLLKRWMERLTPCNLAAAFDYPPISVLRPTPPPYQHYPFRLYRPDHINIAAETLSDQQLDKRLETLWQRPDVAAFIHSVRLLDISSTLEGEAWNKINTVFPSLWTLEVPLDFLEMRLGRPLDAAKPVLKSLKVLPKADDSFGRGGSSPRAVLL